MRSMLITGVLMLATTSGCVVYESDGGTCWEDGFCNGDDGTDPGTPDDQDSAEPEDLVQLAFFPGQAEQGEVFLAGITVIEGDVSLLDVTDIRIYGDADLLVWGAREREITATVQVKDDGEGVLDVLVEFADGSAEMISGALTIYPSGSGHPADDWSDSDPGDGGCE